MAIMTVASLLAQQPPPTPINPENIPTTPPAVAKLGPGLYRIGEITVDTAKREASVAGKVNPVETVEFVANTRDGLKAYESALTLDTYAVTFNAAMLLLGLDKDHARVPLQHFDPAPPQGDRVTIWIDWTRHGERVRTPVEHVLFDKETRKPIPESEWVYTGSTFVPEGPTQKSTRCRGYRRRAHRLRSGPAPIIENVAGAASAATGSSC
jgi:hypothetical protein